MPSHQKPPTCNNLYERQPSEKEAGICITPFRCFHVYDLIWFSWQLWGREPALLLPYKWGGWGQSRSRTHSRLHNYSGDRVFSGPHPSLCTPLPHWQHLLWQPRTKLQMGPLYVYSVERWPWGHNHLFAFGQLPNQPQHLWTWKEPQVPSLCLFTFFESLLK